jgi:hypothetical protein
MPSVVKRRSHFLSQTPSFPGMWMNLQLDYEFLCADREKGEAIRKELRPCAA